MGSRALLGKIASYREGEGEKNVGKLKVKLSDLRWGSGANRSEC